MYAFVICVHVHHITRRRWRFAHSQLVSKSNECKRAANMHIHTKRAKYNDDDYTTTTAQPPADALIDTRTHDILWCVCNCITLFPTRGVFVSYVFMMKNRAQNMDDNVCCVE